MLCFLARSFSLSLFSARLQTTPQTQPSNFPNPLSLSHFPFNQKNSRSLSALSYSRFSLSETYLAVIHCSALSIQLSVISLSFAAVPKKNPPRILSLFLLYSLDFSSSYPLTQPSSVPPPSYCVFLFYLYPTPTLKPSPER